MTRIWTAVGLLSAFWLFGLGLYRPESWFWAVMCLLLAVLLLRTETLRLPSVARSWTAMLMLLPAVWVLPPPFKAAPLLIALGLGLVLVQIPRRWSRGVGRSAVVCGALLSAQSVAVWAYCGLTARSHDLPWPLTTILEAAMQLGGADVSAAGGSINNAALAVRTAGGIHRLTASWDLFFDPATLCFLVGGWGVLALSIWQQRPQETVLSPLSTWLRRGGVLTLLISAWLPLRAALLVTLYISRAARADADWPLTVMDQFLSPWPSLILLAVPVLLAVRFVSVNSPTDSSADLQQRHRPPRSRSHATGRRYAMAVSLAAVAVALLWSIWSWDPVGHRKAGRVVVVEKNSRWEPTDAAYDKTAYGEPASYTYSLIYDYCSHFLQMSRLMQAEQINDRRLADCDVLILKTPTARFSHEEVEAIRRFVHRGGGLLLIGDHTNVFNSSTYLNDVARKFGFSFANDLLFRVGTPYQQPLQHSLIPHPAVCHLDEMDFAVSCSIDPGSSSGQAVIQSEGLWSLPPQYGYPNFHPPAHYRPEMRHGAFIQLWTTRYGRGRVAAFSDSTIFSNFCVFQPGKAKLFLGMLEWLNRSSPLDNRYNRLAVSTPLTLLGIVALIAAAWMIRREQGAWLGLLTAGIFGFTLASVAVAAVHRRCMPWPQPTSPPKEVVIDREISKVSLSKGASGFGPGERFGLLEQWIPRIGFFTHRRSGAESIGGDALVVICPSGSVDPAYRRRLVEYVQNGGRLLVFDSPTNRASTANSLLWPFGLSLQNAAAPLDGQLTLPDGTAWPGEQIEMAWAISDGRPLVMIDGTAVAARCEFGRGSVTAIGFASAFNDASMGGHWMQPPDDALLTHYKLLFLLLESALQDKEMTATEQKSPKAAVD